MLCTVKSTHTCTTGIFDKLFNFLGEFASALRKKTDIRVGLYHCLHEWYNPLYLRDKALNFTTRNYVDVSLMLHSMYKYSLGGLPNVPVKILQEYILTIQILLTFNLIVIFLWQIISKLIEIY